MTTPFLFVQEEPFAEGKTPGVSSLIRGQARKFRLQKQARQEHYTSPPRKICPKDPPGHEERASAEYLYRILAIFPDQTLQYRILQLEPESQSFIHFYLSWNVSQAHSSLPCALSWPKTIASDSFSSDLHSLALPCYIASMTSYLSLAPFSTEHGFPKPDQEAPEVESQVTGSDTYFDWDSPRPWLSSVFPYGSDTPETSHTPEIADIANPELPKIAYPWGLWESCDEFEISSDAQICSAPAFGTLNFSVFDEQSYQELPTYTPESDEFPVAADLAHLTHLAIQALQIRLSSKKKTSSSSYPSDLLFPVWCLFRAAVFQGDELAAASHQRFLRHLIYRTDGSKLLWSRLADVALEDDCKIRLESKEDLEKAAEILVKSELRERMVRTLSA